jgi:hypothetical protein
MKKTTLLSGKIAFPKLSLFNKRILETRNRNNHVLPVQDEDSGDRSAQAMPEIGECNLGKALLQFELERVRFKNVA